MPRSKSHEFENRERQRFAGVRHDLSLPFLRWVEVLIYFYSRSSNADNLHYVK